MKNSNTFLYAGLTLLFVALLGRGFGFPAGLFWTLFGVAIGFKVLFLFTIFREKRRYSKTGLYLILTGITLILLSLPFKSMYPIPVLRNVLFYGAIIFKISGLIVLILKRPAVEEAE